MIGLTEALDSLEALANAVQTPPAILELNVYRWWEPNMRMPAVWHWLTPSGTRYPDTCKVADDVRLTVSIGVRPTASTGEDAQRLEQYADAYVPALDTALNDPRTFGGPQLKRARRVGLGPMVSEKLGDSTVLAIEIPLELTLEHTL